MLTFFRTPGQIRRLTDRGLEILVEGANTLRFHHEIHHPGNRILLESHRALRQRQLHLRADLAALMDAGIDPNCVSVQAVVAELDACACAMSALREDALDQRPGRILREVAARLVAA